MYSSIALSYFAAVARQGSFQAGAAQMRVALSAVSRQVALLEREAGAPLFERSRGRRPLRLTPAGEAMLLHVQELEASAARLAARMREARGQAGGHLRIGLSDVFIRQVFPPALALLNARHPGLVYEVEIGSMRHVLDLLARGDLDLGVVFNPVHVTGVRRLVEVAFANHVLVASTHPLARRQAVTLADCAEHGIAMPGTQLSSHLMYEEMFAKAGVRPNVVFTSNSYEMLLSAAAAGAAIAFVNATLFEAPSLLPGQGCRFVGLIDPLVEPTRLVICAPHGRTLAPPAQELVALLAEALGSRAAQAEKV